ncbi:HAD family hydrolase [Paenibacillaceae bacterium]|nr:HAD family hydrolase [Paenibacillaceae bacterium]
MPQTAGNRSLKTGDWMEPIKYLFFDCMETIVDLYELPSENDYAYWAYHQSGVERYWQHFDDFLARYNHTKQQMKDRLAVHQEYEMKQRIELLVSGTESIIHNKQEVTDRLYNHYWETYKSQCFVKPDVKEVILQLKGRYRLAVVSNFMVENGIEQLLKDNGLSSHFEFIVTSINCGWRKPGDSIYRYAMSKAQCQANEILFIGDDYDNDYVAPRKHGMNAIWLDKLGVAKDGIDAVHHFSKLAGRLLP